MYIRGFYHMHAGTPDEGRRSGLRLRLVFSGSTLHTTLHRDAKQQTNGLQDFIDPGEKNAAPYLNGYPHSKKRLPLQPLS